MVTAFSFQRGTKCRSSRRSCGESMGQTTGFVIFIVLVGWTVTVRGFPASSPRCPLPCTGTSTPALEEACSVSSLQDWSSLGRRWLAQPPWSLARPEAWSQARQEAWSQAWLQAGVCLSLWTNWTWWWLVTGIRSDR